MSDKEKDNGPSVDVDVGGTGWLAVALLFIFFYGDPDLCDAMIRWLMK